MAKLILSPESLKKLGIARLATLLNDAAVADKMLKQRLMYELTARESPKTLAKDVARRLAAIAKPIGPIKMDKVMIMSTDLEIQHHAIVALIAPVNAQAAFDLLWDFIALADAIYRRAFINIYSQLFCRAEEDLVKITAALAPEPAILVERVFIAVAERSESHHQALIANMAASLGPAGLAELKAKLTEWRGPKPPPPPNPNQRSLYYSQFHLDLRGKELRYQRGQKWLQQVAIQTGDIDGFIALFDAGQRQTAAAAAEIAGLLRQAGRVEEALVALDAVDPKTRSFDCENERVLALESLGRTDEARGLRETAFRTGLDARHLRALIKSLPDFDDIDAEQAGIAHAMA
jgi:tetratricopeptide (TPR) repeat protein